MVNPRPEWRNASNRYGTIATARIAGGAVLLVVLLPTLVTEISPLLLILLVPALGSRIYKLTILLHDCAHGTLFRRRTANRIVGHLCAWALGTQFAAFSDQHWRHHRSYGSKDDPQGRDYNGLRDASRAALLWHLIRPVVGLNLLKLGEFQETVRSRPRSRWPGVAGVLAVQASLALLACRGDPALWWLALVYPASAATIGLFLSQIRGFCEHVAMPPAASDASVRTHLPNPVDSAIFYDLNFNYHVAHHLYPGIPSCHLPMLHAALDATTSGETSPSIAATIRRRLALTPRWL